MTHNNQQQLSGREILAADDLPPQKVETPEWGEGRYVHVRMLSALGIEGLKDFGKDAEGESEPNFLGRFAALMLCDEGGQRLCADSDAEQLAGRNPTVLERIMRAAMAHNGMTKAAEEQTAKNSEQTPVAG